MSKVNAEEKQVVETMAHAYLLAKGMFGAQTNHFAVLEIYDFLEISDEESFMTDLENMYKHAQTICDTKTPTPEMVFGLFERVFLTEEGES